MTKRKTPEGKRREYDELSAFFRRFPVHYYALHGMKSYGRGTPDPRFESEEWKEAQIEYHGLSQLLAGAREAANDAIQMSQDITVEQVRRLDAALRAEGLLTLSEVRARYWGRYKSILKRGRIRGDVEFRLVTGILGDVDSSIPDEEREILGKLALDYEQKA